MKKYKTWEALKLLTENPKLKFEDCNTNARILIAEEPTSIVNKVTIKNERPFNNNLLLQNNWILVQQPVSFMEAIEAYEKGKIVNCQVENKIFKYNPYKANGAEIFGDGGFEITDIKGNTITTIEILRGKWLIEEGETHED